MPSVPFFKARFTSSWIVSVSVILVVLGFLQLGCWQLNRAHEKRMLLAAFAKSSKSAPILWQDGTPTPNQYQPIQVRGHFLPSLLFLDNQHYHHQFGYHVLSPFLVSPDKVILIDRGWIAGDITRQQFPAITTPETEQTIGGSVFIPSKTWLLGPAIEKINNKIAVLEQVDFYLCQEFLHKSVYPFIIRLNENHALGFIRHWPIVSMPPERHQAYAVQWFAMASMVLILYFYLGIKKKK